MVSTQMNIGKRRQEEIHVVLSPDRNYAVHAGVVVASVLLHTTTPEVFHFYYLQGNEKITDEDRRQTCELVKEYGAALDFVRVNEELFQTVVGKEQRYITVATYYRLLVAELLVGVERCIYLDSDVVVLVDLAELWETGFSDRALGVVPVTEWDEDWLKLYPQIRHYFNAGVLYFNLRRWRECSYAEKCLQLLAKNPAEFERCLDQDLLNIALCDDLFLLHPRWNLRTREKLSDKKPWSKKIAAQWREALRRPGIVHYTGRNKPWHYDMRHDWSMEYWRILRKTPWGKESSNFQGKMFMARLCRCKALISKAMNWLCSFRCSAKKGIFRITLCGVRVFDFAMDKSGKRLV